LGLAVHLVLLVLSWSARWGCVPGWEPLEVWIEPESVLVAIFVECWPSLPRHLLRLICVGQLHHHYMDLSMAWSSAPQRQEVHDWVLDFVPLSLVSTFPAVVLEQLVVSPPMVRKSFLRVQLLWWPVGGYILVSLPRQAA